MRQSWTDYFLDLTAKVSTRSTCLKAQVGALIVLEHRIIASGYNGAISGEPHCLDEGCLEEEGRCQRAIHAEVNAITQCAKFGLSCKDSTMYIYYNNLKGHIHARSPGCRECNKVIRATGIKTVVVQHADEPGHISYFSLTSMLNEALSI